MRLQTSLHASCVALAVAVVLLFPSTMYALVPVQAQEPDVAYEGDVTIRQNLFRVEPTLEVDDLEYYASKKSLFRGTSSLVVFGSVFVVIIGLAIVLIRRSRDDGTAKKEGIQLSTLAYLAMLGALTAVIFLILISALGAKVPEHLQERSIPVVDGQTFTSGDHLRAMFEVKNNGTDIVQGIVFRDSHAKSLRIPREGVMFTKESELPKDAAPLLTQNDLLVNIGDLAPGETAWITVNFILLAGQDQTIENVGTLTVGSEGEVQSNTVSIQRNK